MGTKEKQRKEIQKREQNKNQQQEKDVQALQTIHEDTLFNLYLENNELNLESIKLTEESELGAQKIHQKYEEILA